jgi:hypothetical protein
MAAALAVVLAATACEKATLQEAPPDKPAMQVKRTDRLEPQYDQAGKLEKLQYDRNGDGKVDTWGYMDGARVVRVEVDENGDSRVDRWEYHRATDAGTAAPSPQTALAGPDRTVERIERSTRFDGTVSRREFFDNGTLTRIEEDTDANGAVDKWETYADGTLSLLALDTSGRGTPDRRLVYRADGNLDRIEEDPTGSGSFRPLKP